MVYNLSRALSVVGAGRLPGLRRSCRPPPEHFQAMVDVGAGCGLRQGEIFGVAVDNIGDLGWLYVRQQVKKVRGGLVFAPPKRGKLRDVPLGPEASAALREHMKQFPPVTLPWLTPSGPKVTHRLVFTAPAGTALWSNAFTSTPRSSWTLARTSKR